MSVGTMTFKALVSKLRAISRADRSHKTPELLRLRHLFRSASDPVLFTIVLSLVAHAAFTTFISPRRGIAGGTAGNSSPVSPIPVARQISETYPNRTTGSYDSQKLLSYLAGQLQLAGWQTEIQEYSATVKLTSPDLKDSISLCAEGENLVAFGGATSAGLHSKPGPGTDNTAVVAILVLAPYDVLSAAAAGTSTGTGAAEPRSSTLTPASEILSSLPSAILLTSLTGFQPGKSQCISAGFVSGHNHGGAGTEAVLEDIATRMGMGLGAAIVIGDVSWGNDLALIVHRSTPVTLAKNVAQTLRKYGLRLKAARIEGVMAHYLTDQTAPGQPTPENLRTLPDKGYFWGEGEILASRGIPCVTLGFPRVGVGLWSGATTGTAIDADQVEDRAKKVADALASLYYAVPTSFAEGGNPGPLVDESIILNIGGNPVFLQKNACVLVIAFFSLLCFVAAFSIKERPS